MHLYKTSKGNILHHNGEYFSISGDWDSLINQSNLRQHLLSVSQSAEKLSKESAEASIASDLQAPIGKQEVWASGVTYLKSRDARMDESKESGAADVYQKVYEAERPELFFKSLPHRVVGNGGEVYIRKDSKWDVPEPELTLYINSEGSIQAYTIGNDMSSRSIEGENPLYLPQAKMYENCAALGPCLYIPEGTISLDSEIRLSISRNGTNMFKANAAINRMKRTLPELAKYLFLEFDFPVGAFLMTGTCLVPPNDFTLQKGDVVEIEIDGIGKLTNTVGLKEKKQASVTA